MLYFLNIQPQVRFLLQEPFPNKLLAPLLPTPSARAMEQVPAPRSPSRCRACTPAGGAWRARARPVSTRPATGSNRVPSTCTARPLSRTSPGCVRATPPRRLAPRSRGTRTWRPRVTSGSTPGCEAQVTPRTQRPRAATSGPQSPEGPLSPQGTPLCVQDTPCFRSAIATAFKFGLGPRAPPPPPVLLSGPGGSLFADATALKAPSPPPTLPPGLLALNIYQQRRHGLERRPFVLPRKAGACRE